MSLRRPLIIGPEVATQPHWKHRRTATLRRVTALFVEHADCLDEIQIGLFDDVFCHLIKRTRPKALEELSRRLATFENAPRSSFASWRSIGKSLLRARYWHNPDASAPAISLKSRRRTATPIF